MFNTDDNILNQFLYFYMGGMFSILSNVIFKALIFLKYDVYIRNILTICSQILR